MPTITMQDARISGLEEVESLSGVAQGFEFKLRTKQERYAWLEQTFRKFEYHRLRKGERSILRDYCKRMTGLSASQLSRLIHAHRRTGRLMLRYEASKKNGFRRKYDASAVALLVETDAAHGHLSGEATRAVLKREYRVFGQQQYRAIATISKTQIYRIRNENRQYRSSEARYLARTKATQVAIGVRAKPRPNGEPGFLRVDTVHSGDLGKQKGAYHINIVDEITQWETIATVPAISEAFLEPVIEELLERFPFVIHEFHSDNGSEFVNHVVAKLLAKLYVRLTKSRARYSNDNALVESKNGAVVRKLYGHAHLPAAQAGTINEFNRAWVNVYLNFHRPCAFPETVVDTQGKQRTRYRAWQTPYEKFTSLENASRHLKPGVTFTELDRIAGAMSDNEYAKAMQEAKVALAKRLRTLTPGSFAE
jgi:transposase InsO family protein